MYDFLPQRCGPCVQYCPSCYGSGGRMQKVRACPIYHGTCCCTGCYRMQWITCHRCNGSGTIAVPAPAPVIYPRYPVYPWGHGRNISVKAQRDAQRARVG